MLKHKKLFIFSVPSRAPSFIRLSNFEQTDVKVQWNPLSQYYANGRLLGYRVYFREYRSYYYYYSYLTESVNTSSANVTMVILRDLKEATAYQIAVTAFTSKGEGPRSYWVSITTGNAIFFVADTTTMCFSSLSDESSLLCWNLTVLVDSLWIPSQKVDSLRYICRIPSPKKKIRSSI